MLGLREELGVLPGSVWGQQILLEHQVCGKREKTLRVNKQKCTLFCTLTCGGISMPWARLTWLLLSTEPAVGSGRAAGQWGALAAAEAHACTGPLLREEQDQLLQRKFTQLLNTALLLSHPCNTCFSLQRFAEGWGCGIPLRPVKQAVSS